MSKRKISQRAGDSDFPKRNHTATLVYKLRLQICKLNDELIRYQEEIDNITAQKDYFHELSTMQEKTIARLQQKTSKTTETLLTPKNTSTNVQKATHKKTKLSSELMLVLQKMENLVHQFTNHNNASLKVLSPFQGSLVRAIKNFLGIKKDKFTNNVLSISLLLDSLINHIFAKFREEYEDTAYKEILFYLTRIVSLYNNLLSKRSSSTDSHLKNTKQSFLTIEQKIRHYDTILTKTLIQPPQIQAQTMPTQKDTQKHSNASLNDSAISELDTTEERSEEDPLILEFLELLQQGKGDFRNKRMPSILPSPPQGVSISPVPGDGSCFFHSISRKLQINSHELRKIALEFMRNHIDRFIGFIPNHYLSFDHYIERMSRSTEYVDHLVIQALSSALNIFILVLNNNEDVHLISPQHLNITQTESAFLETLSTSQIISTYHHQPSEHYWETNQESTEFILGLYLSNQVITQQHETQSAWSSSDRTSSLLSLRENLSSETGTSNTELGRDNISSSPLISLGTTDEPFIWDTTNLESHLLPFLDL